MIKSKAVGLTLQVTRGIDAMVVSVQLGWQHGEFVPLYDFGYAKGRFYF